MKRKFDIGGQTNDTCGLYAAKFGDVYCFVLELKINGGNTGQFRSEVDLECSLLEIYCLN